MTTTSADIRGASEQELACQVDKAEAAFTDISRPVVRFGDEGRTFACSAGG